MDIQEAKSLIALLDIVQEKAKSFSDKISYYNSSKDPFVQGLNEAGQQIILNELKVLKNEYVNAKMEVDHLLKKIELE